MDGFALVNETSDTQITWDVIQKAARALALQQAQVADWWQLDALPVAASQTEMAAPADFIVAKIVNVLDDPNALAYHTIGANGRPLILIGWNIIKANGGDLYGPTGLTAAASHELVETRVDPYCGFLVDMPDGKTTTVLEACDWVQGDAYANADEPDVHVSNFVGPRAFKAGETSGLDYMERLTAAFTMSTGGYMSVRVGGQGAEWTDSFAAKPEHGGMPEWLRTAKRCAGSRYSMRRR